MASDSTAGVVRPASHRKTVSPYIDMFWSPTPLSSECVFCFVISPFFHGDSGSKEGVKREFCFSGLDEFVRVCVRAVVMAV